MNSNLSKGLQKVGRGNRTNYQLLDHFGNTFTHPIDLIFYMVSLFTILKQKNNGRSDSGHFSFLVFALVVAGITNHHTTN